VILTPEGAKIISLYPAKAADRKPIPKLKERPQHERHAKGAVGVRETRKIPEATRLRLFSCRSRSATAKRAPTTCSCEPRERDKSPRARGRNGPPPGFAAAMNKDDYTFCTYRGHHHTSRAARPCCSVLAS